MKEADIATYDVGVVGGGICGASVAAFLAEEGLRVGLFERATIAAAASGRNSGVIQHPFDPHLAELHRESLEIYRELATADSDFDLPDEPVGILMVSPDRDAVASAVAGIATQAPELQPEMVGADALQALEPMLAPGLTACRLATGYPVAPATATRAMADRARRARAVLEVGREVQSVVVEQSRAVGLRMSTGERVGCGRIVVAAGPWTPTLVPGWALVPPIVSVWGVVVSTSLPEAPGHVIEELGIDRPGQPPEELFSLVTAVGDSSIGSTFLAERPDASQRAPELMRRAATFVPALANSPQTSVRSCARPVAFDGRPIIGAIEETDGLLVCAGHGPWGISTGPGSARRLVELMLRPDGSSSVFTPRRVATG